MTGTDLLDGLSLATSNLTFVDVHRQHTDFILFSPLPSSLFIYQIELL